MPPSDSERPSRARFALALWLCGLSSVLYLDRVCMSQAIKPIQEELDLTNTQMSFVMMAFTLAYGLFEIPTGRLGDRHGSRSVLTRIVVWWSVFTALTGACSGFITLLLVRFLFGAGEAGAFPNAARVIARWYPVRERGRVQGVMLAAAQFGAVAAPAATAGLIEFLGWRWTFAIFGLFGLAWAAGFWWWFRDDPATHPSVNAAELAIIQIDGTTMTLGKAESIPWRQIFRNRGILVLGSIMILGSFYSYFFYSWFPKYLTAARGIDNLRSGTLASIVIGGSAVGMLLGGGIADLIPRLSSDPVLAKRRLCVGCYLTAAGCLFAGIRCDNAFALAGLWGASFCAMHITLPIWWSVAIPQCGRHVGVIFGLMNGVGVIGAMASQFFVGRFSDWRASEGFTGREQWDPMFDVYVIGLILSSVAWWLYRVRPLDDDRSSIQACPSTTVAR